MRTLRPVLCLLVASLATSACTSPVRPDSATELQTARTEAARAALARVEEGRAVLMAGVPDKAIRDYFDPVIAEYEARYDDPDVTVYSAWTPEEGLAYMIMHAAAGLEGEPATDAIVADGVWAYALNAKAYALVELGRYLEARTVLERAQAMAPMHPMYILEYAFTWQITEDWHKAIEEYRRAADVAENGIMQEEKNDFLARAWRGEGFALIELGEFDAAEALYHKCLELNPDDKKALNELGYIEHLRRSRSSQGTDRQM